MASINNKALFSAATKAMDYVSEVDDRTVAPSESAVRNLDIFEEDLPETGKDEVQTIDLLDRIGSPATMASTGGRYFGFVVGGTHPAALAANWLSSAWDQNAGLTATSPVSAAIEKVCERWITEILPVAKGSAVGFVTGVTMANFSALAAARSAILAKLEWDVETRGLTGAPQIKVVVGAEAHASLFKALRLLGMGTDHIIRVPGDENGCMRKDLLPVVNANTIVCLQAGNVNTGGMDDGRLVLEAKKYGAWVHIDGAFGLWTSASSSHRHLTTGYEYADSWATDGHKWLNVPYDSGVVICRRRDHLRKAMSVEGSYLDQPEERVPYKHTPELSRRARAIDIWATLRTLGKHGMDDLITRTCGFARQFAQHLSQAGFEILNEVTTNQVLVSFGSDSETLAVTRAIQADGTCWAGTTVWRGRVALRISVSSWKTTDNDVTKSIQAIIKCARMVSRKAA